MSALVLLHGFTGAPESFDAVRAHLPSGIVVHAPACLGHADARDVSVASFEDEVDRLASTIAAVTTPPRVLAGYSMGGRLALGLLARHSGLFEHAVIVSAHPGLEDASAREARRRDDARWVKLLREDGVAAFVRAWEAEPIFATQRDARPEAFELQRRIRASQSAEGLARSLEVCGLGAMPPLLESVAAAGVAIDLVVGEEDSKFLALARTIRERIPRAGLFVIPGAGHNLALEAPEALARVLRMNLRGDER